MASVGIVLENVKFEWLHLVAHMIAGAMTQNKDNLVAATKHANTDMIFAENELALLLKRYPEGVKLEVTAILETSDNTTLTFMPPPKSNTKYPLQILKRHLSLIAIMSQRLIFHLNNTCMRL